MRRRRIALLTVGTRGDAQPFAALALALDNAGYAVRVGAPRNFRPFFENLGIAYVPLGMDAKVLFERPEMKAYFKGGPIGRLRRSWDSLRPMLRSMMDDMPDAVGNADAVICHLTAKIAFDVCEARRIPAAMAAFQPISPTAEFPLLIFNARTLGPLVNRLTYNLLRYSYLKVQSEINRWRRSVLGLGPRRIGAPVTHFLPGELPTIIYGISPTVLPRPADWPDNAHLTGYWFLDAHPRWTPPPELAAFLADGAPPIYVGFGSIPGGVTPDIPAILTEALKRTGLRAVVNRGWGAAQFDADKVPDFILPVDDVPHEHLFPRMAGIVHHAGAGVSAAGLRAGRPTLACPFNTDQPWWARRLHELGVGPKPLPLKKWTADRVAKALEALLGTPSYAEAATRVAERLEAENMDEAVRTVRQIFGEPQMAD
jgi:sterol 3beta-glucosyltransferase